MPPQSTQAVGNDIKQLAEDAHALLAATAETVGDKVKEARQRLTAALERTQHAGNDMRKQVLNYAHKADTVVRQNPYPSIAIGVGVGALLGFLISRR